MTHTFAKELPLLIFNIFLGVIGFVMSLGWGKVTGTRMTEQTIRRLAIMWIGLIALGMVFAFVV